MKKYLFRLLHLLQVLKNIVASKLNKKGNKTMTDFQGKLILLSGPSGVGKGPLTKTFELYLKASGGSMKKHVLYTTRKARPWEKDGREYHFSDCETLNRRAEVDKETFKTFSVHNDTQALDFAELKKELSENNLVFLEIYSEYITELLEQCETLNIQVKRIFVTPLSENDYNAIGCLPGDTKARDLAAKAVMYTKLTNRGTETPKNIRIRAGRSAEEIQKSKEDGVHILVNHYGEDNRALWDSLQDLIGRPGGPEIVKTFLEFAEVLTSE
jgi:guanylate kinase